MKKVSLYSQLVTFKTEVELFDSTEYQSSTAAQKSGCIRVVGGLTRLFA